MRERCPHSGNYSTQPAECESLAVGLSPLSTPRAFATSAWGIYLRYMATRLEEIRQLREFVGQKLHEGAAEAPLRDVLMREGGWSKDDLDMIFAQVKATAMQSPLEPTKPETPSTESLPVPITTTVTTTTTAPLDTLSFDVPQPSPEPQGTVPTPTPEVVVSPVATHTAAPEASETPSTAPKPTTPSLVQGTPQSHFSLLFARLPYLRRMLYVVAVGLVVLAAFLGYRIAQWLQPTDRDGAMQEVTPVGGEDTPAPAETEDINTPNFPVAPPTQDPAAQDPVNEGGTVDPMLGEVSDPDLTVPVSEAAGPSVRTVAIGSADAGRVLAPGDKVLVSWEQSGARGEYTSFTLKHVDSDAEYGNAGGGYFASGHVEASAYIPFGAPTGTYHVRVYVRPATCFPAEFKNLIQGYQPLLASTETNWCAEESYTLSDSSNTLSITSEE